MLASTCGALVPFLLCNLIQVGSLCLAVIRQTLPGRLRGTHVTEPVHVQAVDSNEESDLEESV
jgi:hypothetical protein